MANNFKIKYGYKAHNVTTAEVIAAVKGIGLGTESAISSYPLKTFSTVDEGREFMNLYPDTSSAATVAWALEGSDTITVTATFISAENQTTFISACPQNKDGAYKASETFDW